MTLSPPAYTCGSQSSEDVSGASAEYNKTASRSHQHETSTITTRTTLTRPNKRRQESDITTDIETTVMALDVDKDPTKAGTMNDGSEEGTAGYSDNDPCTQGATMYPLVQNRMFDIPEIIRCVAEFLDKPSLAASCRVSRMWATHCTPLLWKHVVDKHWRDGRFYASIRSQAHYIRTMKCEDKTDYEEMLLCDLPRLKAIAFHGSKEQMAIKEKVLAKASKTLTSLVLSSVCSVLSADTVKAVRNLTHLTTLKLHNVNLKRRQLAEILIDCENLGFLSLSRVQLQSLDGDINEGSDDGVSGNLVLDNIFSSQDVGPTVTKIKYLALKEISVSSAYLAGLIKNCPALLELSLARNENLPITTDMILTMKASCPRLYALDVGSCKRIDRETFSTLFSSLTQLTVINLSGTKVADEELLLLAENCKRVARLDIQYCTQITSNGLHQFLSHCGTSLRHLEASGVNIEPESFDWRQWTCTNLQILFVHIGLVGSPMPSRMSSLASGSDENTNNSSISGQTGESSSSTYMAVDNVGNDKKRPQDAIAFPATTLREIRNSLSDTANSAPDPTTNSMGPAATADQTFNETDVDVVMRHPLHPIQDVCNIQYLGLMGAGAKLTCATQNQLINGFRSVKRLHVLELYQAFKKEDLEWLVEHLPELCRIDAEKYNVSDELLKWFEEAYPHVQICRQE
ncbi:hypothetical protein BGZ58_009221 [Dissophora ornata]|nr:hypothetical protein BGZ58_009221 [Dissophora ornata]